MRPSCSRALRSAIPIWILFVGSIAPASASDDPEDECLQGIWGGGCLSIEGDSELRSADRRQRVLMSAASADPASLSNEEWSDLVYLVAGQPDRRGYLAARYRERHWQEPAEDDTVTENPRVWAQLWRDSRPESRDAWCRWASHVETEAALNALRQALDDDPTNAGARECLVRRLATLGELDIVQAILADHPIERDEDDGWDPDLSTEQMALYRLYGDLGDFDAQMDLVRQALAERPWDASLQAFVSIFGDGGDDERLEALVFEDLPLHLLLMICDSLMDDEACQDHLVDRALEMGTDRRDLPAGTLFRLRSTLIERAVAQDDAELLDEVLFDGSDVGRQHLWAMAVDTVRSGVDLDDEEAESDERRISVDALCRRIDAAVLGGEVDARVLDGLGSCPERLQHLSLAIAWCRGDAPGPTDPVHRYLLDGLVVRMPDWPTDVLLEQHEPLDAVIAELERRIEAAPDDLRLLDRLAQLTRDADVDPARALAIRERLLLLDPGDEARCDWLDAFVSAHPGTENEAWTVALKRWPDWHDLRLQLMASSDTGHGTVRQLADQILDDPAASVRQKAEARYHLGNKARRLGRFSEAVAHVEAYYLKKLSLFGCPSYLPECDSQMFGLLAQARDRERIAAYLKARRAIAASRPDLGIGEQQGLRWLQRRLDAGCGLDRPWSDELCSTPFPTQLEAGFSTMGFCD